MSEGHLTNNQLFRKYRLRDTRPPTDKHIACYGKWVESATPPHKFYNGWYPVRACSFSGHEPIHAAGVPNVKASSFRNYRVVCDVCDAPDLTVPYTHDDHCGNHKCKPNSVAPRDRPLASRCPSVPCASPQGQIPNAHWRFHDPQDWSRVPTLPADTKAHRENWFSNELDQQIHFAQAQKEAARRDRIDRDKKAMSKRQTEANHLAQQRLAQQQAACSFNNPIETPLVPLPGPPVQGEPEPTFEVFVLPSDAAEHNPEDTDYSGRVDE